MPAIRFFGSLAPTQALYPSTVPIPLMTSDQIWSSYIRPMGAGAVAAAGVITLAKTLPTIWSALLAGIKDVRAGRAGQAPAMSRVERDMLDEVCRDRIVAVLVMMWGLLTFRPIPGAQTSIFANLIAVDFRRCVRIFVRHGVFAHLRTDRQFVKSHQRHGHRDADGHLRHVSGGRLDGRHLRRAGPHDRRRCLRGGGQWRRHFAGFEDRDSWWAPRRQSSRSP